MPTGTDYLLAWCVYLLSAVALLFVVWRLTRRFWFWLRDPLRVLAAVILITPSPMDQGLEHLAPALFVIAFELLGKPDGGIGTVVAIRLLLIALVALLGIGIVGFLWYWLVEMRRSPPAPAARAGAPARVGERSTRAG